MCAVWPPGHQHLHSGVSPNKKQTRMACGCIRVFYGLQGIAAAYLVALYRLCCTGERQVRGEVPARGNWNPPPAVVYLATRPRCCTSHTAAQGESRCFKTTKNKRKEMFQPAEHLLFCLCRFCRYFTKIPLFPFCLIGIWQMNFYFICCLWIPVPKFLFSAPSPF